MKKIIIFLLLASTIGCDQVSKHVVRQNIKDEEKIEIFSHHLTLTKVENFGAFLSLGNALPDPLRFILLSIFPLVMLTIGTLLLLTRPNLTKPAVLGICFVLGGGLGNIIDRIVYGSVTDFVHIQFGIFQTGVFNLADASIMTGILIILIHSSHKGNNMKQNEQTI